MVYGIDQRTMKMELTSHKNDNATGLPIILTEYLRDTLNITTFVETGTGLGRTSKIASSLFEHVYTIEASPERYELNVTQFRNTNVTCILGESPTALQKVVRKLKAIAIVFLDAHCIYRQLVIKNLPCPLLFEIAVIPNQHIIIIDDAHWFVNARHPCKDVFTWPELNEVVLALYERNNPYTFVEGKSIVSVPRQLKLGIQNFLYKLEKENQ